MYITTCSQEILYLMRPAGSVMLEVCGPGCEIEVLEASHRKGGPAVEEVVQV